MNRSNLATLPAKVEFGIKMLFVYDRWTLFTSTVREVPATVIVCLISIPVPTHLLLEMCAYRDRLEVNMKLLVYTLDLGN